MNKHIPQIPMAEQLDISERCMFCGQRRGTLLCDFPRDILIFDLPCDESPTGKTSTQRNTCDCLMCEQCAYEVELDKHFCPHCTVKLLEKLLPTLPAKVLKQHLVHPTVKDVKE